jgi:hypothetical protein
VQASLQASHSSKTSTIVVKLVQRYYTIAAEPPSSRPRYDAAGASIWSGAYIGAGYLFSEQLEAVVRYASRMSSNLLLLFVTLFAGWIGWKFLQRRRFLRQLKVARITPAELHERLEAREEVFIVDLRSGLAGEAALIPGAVRIAPEELTVRGEEIPRDREIILFCS